MKEKCHYNLFPASSNFHSITNQKLLCKFIEITLRHGCSPVNLLHISRTPFPKKTSGRLFPVIVAKDSHAFLLRDYALSQLEFSLPPQHMRIDSNQVINVNMIYDHLESKTSDCLPQLHSVTGNDICHKNLLLERSMLSKYL